jgi:UDP-N-acetylglucosamine 2-epimerase (non-hydrolysing)
MAASLVAAKLLIPVAHVEAGLRSGDRTMPEEINRIVTDRLADLLLTPSADADENLKAEGVDASKIHLVGNVMIDTLLKFLPAAGFERISARWPLRDHAYAVLTLHRPSNVDEVDTLHSVLEAVRTVARDMPVVFPVHPRTRSRLSAFGMNGLLEGVTLVEPLGYIDFLALTSHARLILTDSGGLQEESTALGIPCLTMRANTERPVTITHGSNRVVGTTTSEIVRGYGEAMAREGRFPIPPLWDGRAAQRIALVIGNYLGRP